MRAPATILAAALLLGGCDRLKQPDRPVEGAEGNAAAPARRGTPAQPQAAGTTPMNQRIAVLGLLNKRNGIARDLTMKPGQAFRAGEAIVRLRACETSPPWEFDKLTGAFVQLDVEQPDGGWKRVFSGWLYKESPSLNVVEHPVYDVWVKSCAMNFPGADGEPAEPLDANSVSSAENSAEPANASVSNAT